MCRVNPVYTATLKILKIGITNFHESRASRGKIRKDNPDIIIHARSKTPVIITCSRCSSSFRVHSPAQTGLLVVYFGS